MASRRSENDIPGSIHPYALLRVFLNSGIIRLEETSHKRSLASFAGSGPIAVWKGGRVVKGVRLEIVYAKACAGSNPVPSAHRTRVRFRVR